MFLLLFFDGVGLSQRVAVSAHVNDYRSVRGDKGEGIFVSESCIVNTQKGFRVLIFQL